MNDVEGDIGALATEAMNLLIEAVEQIPAESGTSRRISTAGACASWWVTLSAAQRRS